MILDTSINNAGFSDNKIVLAILASILLHILVAVVVPNFNFPTEKEKKQILKIELQQPTPPAPAPVIEPLPPVALPEPPKQEPPKPEPVKEKITPVEPKPIKKEVPTPADVPELRPPPSIEDVIAVQPTVNDVPELAVPADPTELPLLIEPPPVNIDIGSILNTYGSLLGRTIAKYKSYPKIAQRRGWQGTVMLDLKIDSSGNVLSAVVENSSGYDALDQRALEMVKQAAPFPAPPEALKGNTFNISVPVAFKLADG